MEKELVHPTNLTSELQALTDAAPSIRQAGRSLLELLSMRFGVERSAFLVRIGDFVDGVAEGLSESIYEQALSDLRSGAPGARSASENGEAVGVRRFPSDRSWAGDLSILPFSFDPVGFSGAIIVEGALDPSSSALVAEALGEVAPALSRLAELEALRRDLRRARGEAARFGTVFDTLPDPVLVLDEEGKVFMANRRADELLMSRENDGPGRRHAVETNSLFFSAFQARTYLGEHRRGELLQVDPRDGSDLLFEVSVLGFTGGEGLAGSSVYMLRDITDLRRAATEMERQYRSSISQEHRARQESERLNVILANAGVPILVTDVRSDIVLMNREAERLFEPDRDARPRAPGFREARTNDAKLTSLISDILLQPGRRREEELGLSDPHTGRAFPASVVLTKITNERGEPTAVVCVLHDLTEKAEVQRLAEELRQLNQDLEARVARGIREISARNRELERQREELVRASRLKTEFLAMMSHELRTPINAILGYHSLLREGIFGELNGQQKRALTRIRSSSDHLLSLINDVLDLSKVEAGKMTLSPTPILVGSFLTSLAETVRPMAEVQGLTFRLEIGESVPQLHTDPTRLRQVVLNLASNAVKFTPKGTVTIRADAVADRARVRFEVEDTGVGIEEEDQAGIFEEFRQIERFQTRERGGTGLGLAISRRLIGLMGGELKVRSVVGEGSTFWFELAAAGDDGVDADGADDG